MTLNKNYSISCYLPEPESKEVVFEYNYSIETHYKTPSFKIENVKFIVFITNKNEDQKVHEKAFLKDIEVNLPEDETTLPFTQITNLSDKIFLDQKLYENGVKTFLAIN